MILNDIENQRSVVKLIWRITIQLFEKKIKGFIYAVHTINLMLCL